MSGLVNYSSEEDQDDYYNKKGGERDRTQRSGRNAVASFNMNKDAKSKLKKHYRERSKSPNSSDSCDQHYGNASKVATPPRNREKLYDDGKNKRTKNASGSGSGGGGNNNNHSSSGGYNDEDPYKSERRSDRYSEASRDKRGGRDEVKHSKEGRGSRDYKDERTHDNYHESKKYDDHKRHSKDYKREYNKRDNNSEYSRDEKYPRSDEKKQQTSTSSYSKDRMNSSTKSRHDERKSHDEKYNERREEKHRTGNSDDRRNSGHNMYGSRREEDRSDYDDKKDRRGNNDEKRSAGNNRPYGGQDRFNSNYRSNSNRYPERRTEDERKYQHAAEDNVLDKGNESSQKNTQKVYSNDTRSNDVKLSPPSEEVPQKRTLPSARNFEALLTLPLSETAPKEPSKITVPVATAATDETAIAVQLPNYYNPKVINATKYATQMQKRKLIWGSKKADDVAAKWGHAQFSQDSDGKVASKFMRLMGIKNAGGGDSNVDESTGDRTQTSPSSTPTGPTTNPDYKTREAMFSTMEQQYEVARQVTHTMRGVGLGFNSQTRPY